MRVRSGRMSPRFRRNWHCTFLLGAFQTDGLNSCHLFNTPHESVDYSRVDMSIATPCKVKICGTTSLADAQMAVDAGADYCGVVLEVSFSERSVPIDTAAEIARQISIPTVIPVFNRATDWVRRAVETIQPYAVQLMGRESPDEVHRLKQQLSCNVWKSLFLPARYGVRNRTSKAFAARWRRTLMRVRTYSYSIPPKLAAARCVSAGRAKPATGISPRN